MTHLIIRLLAFVYAVSALTVQAQPQQSYWNGSTWTDPDRGFLWYAPEKPKQKTNKEKRKPLEQMSNKELGAEIDRLLDIASRHPTPEAVKEFLYAQQYAMERASVFSDVVRRTVWTTPDLDYSLKGRPTNAMAIAAYDANRDASRRSTAHSLSRTHGIFFFFKGSCGYCHQFAPVLKMFERSYGVEVFPVSLDGGGIPDYPNAKLDNGAAQKLGVNMVPAIFIANKRTGKIQPIGYGIMSMEELTNRIHVLTQTQPGQEY